MEALLKDIRSGVRNLIKHPGFAAIALLTLALGIGANTAIFSVVNAVLLRPLPYPNAAQLVMIWGKLPSHGLDTLNASAPEFVDYRDRNHTFSGIAAYASLGRNLTGAGAPERLNVTFATAGFFPVLATTPLRGRTFLAEEDQPGHNAVVILSHSLWQRRFAADDNVIGRSIMLDGVGHTVVGVMPQGFNYPDNETQLWKPMAFAADDLSENSRGSHYLDVIARTKPGVTLAQANTELASIAKQMQKEHPDRYEENSGWGATAVNLQEEIVGNVRVALSVLLGVVGFVLLIACANVASLVLVHAGSRRREIAIRTALGASRAAIVRQLLIESLILSLVGGGLGLLIASWGTSLLAALSPAILPRVDEVHLDSRVIVFSFAVSALTGLVFGTVPALQVSKLNLSDALKQSSSKATETTSRRRFRGLLVVSEVALTMVLLVGAGLMIKSMHRLQQVDLGFDPSNVLTFRVALPATKYAEPQAQRRFFDELSNKIESEPGVRSAGLVNLIPLGGSGNRRSISVENKPENPTNAEFRLSNAQYFEAMRAQLRKGRFFDHTDREDTQKVVVVNESFVKVFLPGDEPLGQRIKLGGPDSPFQWLSIVGVIKDFKHRSLDVEASPEMYVPYSQPPLPKWNVQSMFLAIRTEQDPASTIGAVRAIVEGIDREQPIYSVATMEQLVGRSVAPRRFNTLLMLIFSGLALLIALIGIYGVMSHSVAQRTREIGIRMALGARVGNVMALVIRSGMLLAVIGVALGIAAAFAFTRLMASLLFEVKPTDAVTFVSVAACLLLVALFACCLPAFHATKVNPLIAMRSE